MRTRLLAITAMAWAPSLLAGSGKPIGIDVLPSLLEVRVSPGGAVEKTVTITNPGEDPLTVVAEPADWTMAETGDIRFDTPGKNPRSCAAWMRVSPDHVLVPARGQATVRVRWEAPADLVGTRWAAVFFRLPAVAGFTDGRPSDVVARVGLTVYVTAAGTDREEIELAELSAVDVPGQGAELRTGFENAGNTAVRMRVTWQIRGASGTVVRTETRTIVSLPQSRREVRRSTAGLPPGRYRVTAMARWGDRRWRAKECELVVPR